MTSRWGLYPEICRAVADDLDMLNAAGVAAELVFQVGEGMHPAKIELRPPEDTLSGTYGWIAEDPDGGLFRWQWERNATDLADRLGENWWYSLSSDQLRRVARILEGLSAVVSIPLGGLGDYEAPEIGQNVPIVGTDGMQFGVAYDEIGGVFAFWADPGAVR